MTITYSSDVFTITPGGTANIWTIFNSSDPNAGGDFEGPIVVCAASTGNPNQTVTPSTAGVEWKDQSSDLTTNCVYHYSLRNDGSETVAASPIFFYD
jgi:hypothetical protein